MSRKVLEPSASHPITIEPTPGEVVVTVDDVVVARTRSALTLDEAKHAPVQYIPLEDVDQSVLRDSAHTSYCPFKGDASYYSVAVAGNEPHADLIWEYRQPFPAVAEIAGRVAFYADRPGVEVSVRP